MHILNYYVRVHVHVGSRSDEETKVFEKHNELQEQFHELVDRALELADAKWNAVYFRKLLSRLPLKYKDEHIDFVTQQIPRFHNAKTIEEIFSYLELYWSYLSTDLLEYVLEKLGNEECKQNLRQFERKVVEFCKKTRLKIYWKVVEIEPASKPKPDNLDLWQLVTIHKPDYLSGNSTLEEVEQFRKKFAASYAFHKVALCISKISPGSVRIVWLVPPSVAPLLRADIELHPERLEELGLLSATFYSSTKPGGGI